MPESPLVSIVLPTCDRSALTRRCLDALVEQTHVHLEIIVIDDGSRDDTPEMLAAFHAAHPAVRLVLLRNETNRGANASRNRGIGRATGAFVAFLDSDCIAEPDWIEELLRGFEDERVAAVTGLVLDPEPRNIYDLTFRGTHRLAQAGAARRLVAGNLCVRRQALVGHPFDAGAERPPPLADGQPDVSYSGACDEEGLFIELQAAGWKMLVRPQARVLHEHYYNRRSFFLQAYRGGRAAAEFVHRYRLRHRLDMVPFILAYGTLPFALVLVPAGGWLVLLAPALLLAAALAAIAYNDLFRKGKTAGETLRSFPMLVAYYHVRLIGYVGKSLSLALGRGAPP